MLDHIRKVLALKLTLQIPVWLLVILVGSNVVATLVYSLKYFYAVCIMLLLLKSLAFLSSNADDATAT